MWDACTVLCVITLVAGVQSVPEVTTSRHCTYDEYNATDITNTDFGADIHESVHLLGDSDFCGGVCEQSILEDEYPECWAFTYNEKEGCHLYYYNRPLHINDNSIADTVLFLKRCSDDISTSPAPTTDVPPTEAPVTISVAGVQSVPAITTTRHCTYDEYNTSDITNTDFGSNIPLNESVHLLGDSDFCGGVCEQSLLNEGLECWAFTYNEKESCHLYYYNRPLYVIDNSIADTVLFLKRCSDDPSTSPAPTTDVPPTEAPVTTFVTGVQSVSAVTTTRHCTYDEYNATDITNTDFGTDVTLIQNTQITLNESVHLLGDIDFCRGVCEFSMLNEGFECWAFTYNEKERCRLYYYNRPLYIIDNSIADAVLFLRRCSDDPSTTPAPTTDVPPSTQPMEPDTTIAMTTTGTGPNPMGIQMITATQFIISGVPSPIQDTCYFSNQTFQLGDHWNKSCRYDCECRDTKINSAICNDLCPQFGVLTDDCSLSTPTGQCCPQVTCDNSTDTNNTIGGSGDGEDCDNAIEKCDYYPDASCRPPYEPWARAHCALRCGFCDRKQPCEDHSSYCALYDLDAACEDYPGWARHYCIRSCAICDY